MNMLRNNAPLQDAWFAKGGQAFIGAVWGWTYDLKDYLTLKEQNENLAQENYRLTVRLADLAEKVAEESVTDIPSGGVAKGFRYIPAKIEKIGNNSQHNYIIIGKGSEDGVIKGSGIITSKGAVGIIDAVSDHFSYARSFKNFEMNVSARLGQNGTTGPLSWDGKSNNGALIKEIPLHMEITPGDTVYTSGYSSIFPPDIPLGVTGESRIVNGSTYEIKVTLFEDYNSLRYVTVVENLNKDEIKSLEGRR